MKPSRELILSTAPYLTEPMDTPRVMLEVLAVLGVCLAAAVWNFGVGALLVVGAACAGAMLTESMLGAVFPMVTALEASSSPSSVPSLGVAKQITSWPLEKKSPLKVSVVSPGSVLSTSHA